MSTKYTELNDLTIGFVGAGNMAQALISGILAKGLSPDRILASDPSQSCRDTLAASGVRVTEVNREVVSQSDIVILAVKPQLMRQIAEPLAGSLNDQHQPLIVSIAAGISSAMLASWLEGDYPIVRCMPNTPALLQAGAAGLYATDAVSDEQRAVSGRLLSAVGEVVWLESEAEIDAVTALSGSGPAYFFFMLEAMISKAVELGLSEDKARLLAQQTALGAAKMTIESDDAIESLRARVTSPNGTTHAAISSFEHNRLAAVIAEAMQAAYDRSIEMEKELA